MRKIVLLSVASMFLLSACVSKKQFTDLETKQKETQDLLNSATVKLNAVSYTHLDVYKRQAYY